MAKQKCIKLSDDLQPTITKDVRTIKFSFDGMEFEIDLGNQNADTFRRRIQKYMDSGRRLNPDITTKLAEKTVVPVELSKTQKMRIWAKDQAMWVNPKATYVPKDVEEAYDKYQLHLRTLQLI